ncbi:MAG TPA: tetratricopeptide repeat-containing glycosyltransferase family protein, partial [Magnetospirillaceae bacterium]|nr:tetratricopeptide repeat-containing glycosyltransferase family protein [Magnetospirillaceae bacterium]
LDRAVRVSPQAAQSWCNLGVVRREAGKPAEAERCFHRALALRPDLGAAINNLAALLKESGNPVASLGCFRAAVRLQPDHPDIHGNLGAALLRVGAYEEGWREHEWRLHPAALNSRQRDLPGPPWLGEALEGRSILLYGEQGFGDMVQFARYAAPVAAAGGRVVLAVAPDLAEVLATVPGVAAVVPLDGPLPDCDFHAALMSCPHLLGTTLETVPGECPYIAADPARVAWWAERLRDVLGLRVGLVWAGNPRLANPALSRVDARRSLPLTRLRPLLALPGVSFVSLQKGEAAAQIAELPAGERPLDPMEAVSSFADTAAILANLDLAITVDTAVAHIAGALGRPVWILSRHDGCWRWLEGREDSPWYPTARLFHQQRPGDWEGVIARIARDLAAFG